MNRRTFLGNTSKASIGTLTAVSSIGLLESCTGAKHVGKGSFEGAPTFVQKILPYSFAALEPSIDAATMEIHFTKHAAAYTKNMTDAIAAENVTAGLNDILSNISKYSTKLRNNAGGHYNHESFWQWMTPGGKPMSAAFTHQLENSFGSVSDFKAKFADAGAKRFGSGWAWLVLDTNKKLVICSTPNQDNPLMDVSSEKGFPLLGIDVWEHAYYLKYQSKRADYIAAWWTVVNWQEVEKRYEFALK